MEKTHTVEKNKSLLILTAALVLITTWAVGATGWTRGLNIITFVGLGAIVIGLMLARSALPAVIAHIFSIVIGIGWSFWVTSRLLPSTYTWQERWDNLAARLYNWYVTAMQGGTSYDNLMFVLQMSVIVWCTSYLTVWFVVRSKRPWLAIVPGGLLLLLNLYYAPEDISIWFILYIMAALLLIVRFNLFSQESQWRANGVFFRPDIGFDFFRDGFIFSVLIIAFAWLTPPLVDTKTLGVFDELQGSWRDLQGNWNRMFADLNYRDQLAYDTFGSSLTLGGARNLSNDPVMDVQVDGIGRYWRAAVYDYYTGNGWVTRDEEQVSYSPETPLSLPLFEMREPVTQTYTYHRNNATVMYAMSNPVSVNRTAKLSFNALPTQQIAQVSSPVWPNNGEPWVEEITYMRSNATVDKDESYQVVSHASRASIEQLEAAGTDYPAWVTERYLNLPPSITDRTRQLALDVTERYDNPYNKAEAIERFLRREIKYNEKISLPPEGVDKVDYILFDLKEGYCDYYASSMIVMLRSQGIPARLAAGFARGTFNSEKQAYEVLNKDAHSWVEVYFPQYGWIDFEPTAAQPVIIRPTNVDDGSFASSSLPPGAPELDDVRLEDEDEGNIPIDDEVIGESSSFGFSLALFGTQLNVPGFVVGGGGLLLLALIVVAVIFGVVTWQRHQQPKSAEDVSSLYRQMVKLAGWMGLAVRPWQTPYEHAAMLQRTLPSYQREVETITNEYVVHTFSGHKNGAGPTAIDTANAWHKLRPEMLKQTFIRRLPRWLRK